MLPHDLSAGAQTVRGARVVESSSDIPEATALPGGSLRRGRDCQVEVQYLLDDVAALGTALATHPPQWLQAEVMAEIARTPQLPSALPGNGTGSFPRRRRVTSASQPQSRRQRSAARTRTRGRGRRTVTVAGILLTAVTGIAVGLLAYRQDESRVCVIQPTAVTQLDTTNQRALRLVADPMARRLTHRVVGGGQATLFVRGRQAALVVAGARNATGGRVYQAWVTQLDGQVDSAGTAGTASDPWSLILTDIHAGQTVSLTVEPADGSPRPTTTPVAAIRL